MKYSKFIDQGTALEIDTPYTPTTWANKLFNDEFQVDISQRLEGKSSTVAENFEHSPFMQPDTRFYLNMDGTPYAMCRGNGEGFVCTHSIHASKVKETFEGVKTEIRVFVPNRGKKLIWTAHFENDNKEEKEVDFFSVFHFEIPNLMSYFTKYEEEGNFIYCSGFPYYVRYEDVEKCKEQVWFKYVISDEKVYSFDGNAQRFYGCDDDSVMPRAVKERTCANKNCEAEPCFSIMQHRFSLKPNEKKTINFVIGITESYEEILCEKEYLNHIDAVYCETQQYWKNVMGCYHIKTPDENFNNLVNFWLKKQLIYFVRLNRGGVYCPVRNQLQDLLGYSLVDHKAAFSYLLNILKLQKHDGYLKQYYHTNGAPDTMLALLRHSDSYIWLILCSVEVIENSGDKSLYEYMVEYSDSPVKESVLTHLQKAADYMFTQTGEHGLCLMLDGDWNDPVNGPGHLGKGESTWNSMALAYAVDRLNEACYSEALHIKNEKLKENINEYCWDGEWYLAGIDDEGIPYGSHNDEEGQRFLNAQTWAIISGVAKEERLEKTIRTIESLKNDYGYVLIDPAFSKYNAVWGRVSQKIMGTTENGSVYNHAVMFKAYADMINGDPDRAMETIQLTLPTNMERFPDDCCGFPLFYSNFYFGQRGDNYGRTSQHYRTGTVAWCLWLVIKQFFGIHISTKGVDIKPAFPKEWKEAEITFRHNEDVYEVKMSEQKVEMYKNRIKM